MSGVQRFKKLPVTIEAIQYDGTNSTEIADFVGPAYIDNRRIPVISTLEGDMGVNSGDWVIKGVKGEFYPCKPNIFDSTYEPA